MMLKKQETAVFEQQQAWRRPGQASPFESQELVQVPLLHQLRKVLVAKDCRLPFDVVEDELITHVVAGT
jgi:hypothetical protein